MNEFLHQEIVLKCGEHMYHNKVYCHQTLYYHRFLEIAVVVCEDRCLVWIVIRIAPQYQIRLDQCLSLASTSRLPNASGMIQHLHLKEDR